MRIPMSNHLVFVKTLINNPDESFRNLQHIIAAFSIPKVTIPLPITAVRRLINQLLIPKIQQRLSLQPLDKRKSEALEAMVSKKVNEYYGWTLKVPKDILYLPTDNLGGGYTNIADINAAVAIKGLLRDLNHDNEMIRQAAHITLQERTCDGNHCKSPLFGEGRNSRWPQMCGYPVAWEEAAQELARLDIEIVATDQSEGKRHVCQSNRSSRNLKGKKGQHGSAWISPVSL
jgi:hypothetical protein